MKRLSLFGACIALSTLGSSLAGEVKFPNQTFTIADGFSIELVAGPPLVDRPIVADFDEQGRLYVADSSGSNDKVDKQLEDKTHRIVRLEDTDGDGRFDKSVVFADRMMFPEGVLWHDGAVYSGAPPSIWKLEDTDGDGIADKRSEWFQGKTLTGCANDLHGPYLGRDGWIYWCKGAFAKQTHERPGRKPISDSAAHIFRQPPDQSDFDSVMSGGMDNPVEVAFTPTGEPIFTTTFYINPSGGQRDALVHAVYGAVFPKIHGVLDGLVRTGELLPPLTHLGPAVPSGLALYESDVFGGDYTGNLFSSQFNLHRVQRHTLQAKGSGYGTVDSDLLLSDNADFHPTDVLEDADGSLLVLDTGGWYKICCPTSQIAKPDVLGAIYRIRRIGTPKIDDPRGLKIAWATARPTELTRYLDDKRPAVRKRAIETLARKGDPAVAALRETLRQSSSALARQNAVWALTRFKETSARAAVQTALDDRDAAVNQAAAHSAGLLRDQGAFGALLKLLNHEAPELRRVAAMALGRIENKSAVPHLLEAAAKPVDRLLEHALIYALIEIADPAKTAAGLKHDNPHVTRAALIALDQMENGGLRAETVLPHLNSDESLLKETASWIVSHHPDWGPQLSQFFRQWLTDQDSPARRAELQKQLTNLSKDAAIQQFIAESLQKEKSNSAEQVLFLNVISQSPLKEMPAIWTELVAGKLKHADDAVVEAAVAAVRPYANLGTNQPALQSNLFTIAKDPARPRPLRLEALSALPSLPALDDQLFPFLMESLEPSLPPLVRTAAAGNLGRARPTKEQQLAIARAMESAGPMEVSKLMGAFEHASDEEVGLALVASLKQSKGIKGLRQDILRARLAKFPASVQSRGEELLQLLNLDIAQQKARLDELQAALSGGDTRRGQLIFNGAKAACSTCHAIGYLGGQIGPDLTRIGSVRTERDLLEAILYPSASFPRGFESMIVSTRDGEEYSGVIRREASDHILLVSGPGVEQRLARADIADMRPGAVSIMPEGLEQQLGSQEMADLIAFLKALK